ncbi:FecR family protein [Flavitalea flava]
MNYTAWTTEDFLTDDSFVRYCYGTDPLVMVYWENIRQQDPGLAIRIDKARELCLLLSVRPSDKAKKNDWERINHSVSARRRPVYRMQRAWLSAAAAVILLVGALFLWWKRDMAVKPGLYATGQFALLTSSGFDGRKIVGLPDGSTVTLNAFSQLRIAPDYNTRNRRIYLEGEAFFKVKDDPERPFIVIAGNSATTVLGTSFKIRNYRSDKHCSVMLDAGKVSVESISDEGKAVKEVLLPGDEIFVSPDNLFTRSKFEAAALQNWKDQQLVFKEASLDQIRDKLYSMFGVEIGTNRLPANPVSFTGEFNGKNLKEILDAIGFTNNFTYKITKDSVLLVF